MENPTLFIERGRLRRGASCPPFASLGGLQIARPGGRSVAEMPAALCTTPLAALPLFSSSPRRGWLCWLCWLRWLLELLELL